MYCFLNKMSAWSANFKFIFLQVVFSLLASWSVQAQNLTIISTGETGTSGSNWNLTDDGTLVTITFTNTASINTFLIEGYLNAGGSVLVTGTDANIWVCGSMSNKNSKSNRMTFKTLGFVGVFANVAIKSTNGPLDVIYWAVYDNSQVSNNSNKDEINIQEGVSIVTRGGLFVLAGGLDDKLANGTTGSDGIPEYYAYKGVGSLGGVNLGSSSCTGTVVSLLSNSGDIVVQGHTNWDFSSAKSGVVSQINLKMDAENYSITEGGSEKVTGTGGEIKKRTFPIKNRSI